MHWSSLFKQTFSHESNPCEHGNKIGTVFHFGFGQNQKPFIEFLDVEWYIRACR